MKTQLPDDWEPHEKHEAKAREKGVNVNRQAEMFREYHLSKGNRYKDWDLAFHTWLRRARPISGSSKPQTYFRPSANVEL